MKKHCIWFFSSLQYFKFNLKNIYNLYLRQCKWFHKSFDSKFLNCNCNLNYYPKLYINDKIHVLLIWYKVHSYRISLLRFIIGNFHSCVTSVTFCSEGLKITLNSSHYVPHLVHSGTVLFFYLHISIDTFSNLVQSDKNKN